MGFGGGGFFGGGADQSSSTQHTVNTNETTNVSGGASEGSFNVSSSGPVTLTDPGVLNLAQLVFERGTELLKENAKNSNELVRGTLTETLAKQTLDSGERLQSIFKYLLIGTGVVMVGLFAMKKFA